MITWLDATRNPKRLWWDLTHSQQPVLWFLAIITGTISAYFALGFWWAVTALQSLTFGATEEALASEVTHLPWWRVIAVPTLGGLIVGLMLTFLMPGKRIHGVSDAIEARLLHRTKLRRVAGFWSALINTIGLGFGLSMGREGPVVHAGATLSHLVARKLKLKPMGRRVLVGCGVAAAISASFSAPIAGVLFALEVVLGHYALSAFAPIVIASAAGTVVARAHSGAILVFEFPDFAIRSLWEMPAFGLLGLVSAVVAMAFMKSLFLVEDVMKGTSLTIWMRTTLAGLLVGLIATQVPQILGVGYETTRLVIADAPGFWILVLLAVTKVTATALTLGSGAGTGVFSPALFLGIMTGAAFGEVAGGVFPDLAAPVGLYALVGMGAVSAAVLGAPISTALICFELTGNYQVAIFTMVAASMASVVTQYFMGGGIFHQQLERRGIPMHEGPARVVLDGITVGHLAKDAPELPPGITLKDDAVRLPEHTSLHDTLTLMEAQDLEAIWVVEGDHDTAQAIGIVRRSDVYKTLSRALLDIHAEEHH